MREGAVVHVVTGAGSGIGRRIAEQSASDGAHVALLDRDVEGLRRTAASIRDAGGSASEHVLDIAVSDEVTRTVEEIGEMFGRIDGLVNAAALLIEGSTTELDEAALLHALSVNLVGPWRIIKAAASLLRSARGSIVNIASIEGLAAAPNHLAYGVSKAGLIGLTRSVAVDLAPDVRCNTVCPGTIITPMSETFLDRMPDPSAARESLASKTMVGRLGTSDDIAAVVRFLLSSESAFVNAATLVADGGRTARVP